MSDSKVFTDIKKLRSPERLALLEVDRVIDICIDDITPVLVLDVGTGSGVFAEGFAAQAIQVTGIDTNPKMLEEAQKHVEQGFFQPANAEAIPHPEEAFEVVFLGLVLHEVNNPLKALKEAKRLASMRVCVLEWPYKEEQVGPPLANRIKQEDFEKMAAQAGFKSVEVFPLKHLVLYRMDI